jgi:hypothetical protein
VKSQSKGEPAVTSRIRNPKDFWAGIIYMAFGLSAIVIGREYGLGTALRMGPAYFPTVLGGLLTLIGAISVIRSFLTPGEPVGSLAFKPMLFIAVASGLFGFLVRGAGLVVAIPILVITTAYASIHFRWGATVLLAIGMTVFCVLVFIKGLGVPLPILGSWFGG